MHLCGEFDDESSQFQDVFWSRFDATTGKKFNPASRPELNDNQT